MSRTTRSISFLSLAVLLTSRGAFAIIVQTGTEDFTLNVNGNVQVRNENSWDGPPPTATAGRRAQRALELAFFLRRASIMVRGEVYKSFTYSNAHPGSGHRIRADQGLPHRGRIPEDASLPPRGRLFAAGERPRGRG